MLQNSLNIHPSGGGVGAYMDVQEAKLREELQGTGVQVIREGDNIRLIMPGNITFETDSYNLRSSFYPVLNSVGQVLAKYGDTTLRVSGHTDNTGSRQYNQTLSERRASSVADYLAKCSILFSWPPARSIAVACWYREWVSISRLPTTAQQRAAPRTGGLSCTSCRKPAESINLYRRSNKGQRNSPVR